MTVSAGLQPERTQLAWHRTALAAAGCAALLLHAAARHGWTLTAVVPAVLIAAGAVALTACGRTVGTAARPVPVALVGALVTAGSLAAVPFVLSGR
jgi:energy-converting hydrogenase Eha subunit A